MKAVSAALRELVRQSHSRRYQVTAHVPGEDPQPLDTVVSGTITLDYSQTTGVRGGQLVVVGEDAIPKDPAHPLAPFGQYVTVEFIYSLPTGEERISMGEFLVIGYQVERPEKRVRVTLGDWAYRVDRTVLEEPRQWAPDVAVEDAIRDLLEAATGQPLTITSDLGGAVIGGEGFVGSMGESSWATAYALADSHDRALYFTDQTSVTIATRPVLGIAGEELNTGERGVIVSSRSSLSATTAYNRVVVTVESAIDANTYRAVRTLTDGPMAYDPQGFGTFALVATYREENATQATADAYAEYLFSRQAGAARPFDMACIPMPWLEPGDTVLVTGPTGSELAVLEAVSLPFEAETLMDVATRAERVQAPTRVRSSDHEPALMRGA